MTANPDDTAALVALATLPGLGPVTLWRCHRETGAARTLTALTAGKPERVPALADLFARRPDSALAPQLIRAARAVDADAVLDQNRAAGQVLVHGTPQYPHRLTGDPWAPAVLFATGTATALAGPTAAIVGTRNATRPGRDLATRLGRELAQAGVSVVSGLALGIDGAAHRGALEATGPGSVVAVVASGIDIAYPKRHAQLQDRVAERGLVLSETPAGHRPTAWRFPARNRIIAALADVVVVVESRSAGGSMHTVKEALARDIPVMAVPGHPVSPSAAGTNDLLADGATPVRDTDDILVTLGLSSGSRRARRVALPGPTDAAQRQVLAAIGEVPASLAEIVMRCAQPLEAVATTLAVLEVDGWVARDGGWFERVTRQGARATTPSGSEPRP